MAILRTTATPTRPIDLDQCNLRSQFVRAEVFDARKLNFIPAQFLLVRVLAVLQSEREVIRCPVHVIPKILEIDFPDGLSIHKVISFDLCCLHGWTVCGLAEEWNRR